MRSILEVGSEQLEKFIKHYHRGRSRAVLYGSLGTSDP